MYNGSNNIIVVALHTTPERDLLSAKHNTEPTYVVPPILQRIEGCGLLRIKTISADNEKCYKLVKISATTTDDLSEPDFLHHFWHIVSQHSPRIIGWDVRTALIPTLQARAIMHGISPAWPAYDPFADGYAYLHDQWLHCDVGNLINLHTPHPASAIQITRALGLPLRNVLSEVELNKLEGKKRTRALVDQLLWQALVNYILFLRGSAFTGELSPHGTNHSIEQLVQVLKGEKRPIYTDFLKQWRANQQRPCTMFIDVKEFQQQGK